MVYSRRMKVSLKLPWLLGSVVPSMKNSSMDWRPLVVKLPGKWGLENLLRREDSQLAREASSVVPSQ